VEEIKDDLGLKADDKAGMMRALKAQGVYAGDVELFSGDDIKSSALNPKDKPEQQYTHRKLGSGQASSFSIGGDSNAKSFQNIKSSESAGSAVNYKNLAGKHTGKKQVTRVQNQSSILFGDDGVNERKIGAKKLHGGIQRQHTTHSSALVGAAGGVVAPQADSKPAKKSAMHASSLSTLSQSRGKSVDTIMSQLRKEMASRGARGICGIGRRFKIADDNENGSLCLDEFKKAMQECAIELSEQDCRQLFNHFDRNGSGDVDYEEFLITLRGPMSERRKQLVGMAFSKMDKDGNGFVDPEDIVDTYDASKHPDVLAGKKSADEVFREFLDTFDVGGEKDGKVTRNEFQNYYANVSSSIDDDDYFELMIRNAWHISGGEGWCANSSNRRVLVTHANGRQTVEEIKDDLGLKADDKAGMMRALRAQGVNVRNVSLYDGQDLKKANSKSSDTYRSQIRIG
jgi:Ca2+-binding EF-hand superfamily protein